MSKCEVCPTDSNNFLPELQDAIEALRLAYQPAIDLAVGLASISDGAGYEVLNNVTTNFINHAAALGAVSVFNNRTFEQIRAILEGPTCDVVDMITSPSGCPKFDQYSPLVDEMHQVNNGALTLVPKWQDYVNGVAVALRTPDDNRNN